jgi:hypothetical protein
MGSAKKKPQKMGVQVLLKRSMRNELGFSCIHTKRNKQCLNHGGSVQGNPGSQTASGCNSSVPGSDVVVMGGCSLPCLSHLHCMPQCSLQACLVLRPIVCLLELAYLSLRDNTLADRWADCRRVCVVGGMGSDHAYL